MSQSGKDGVLLLGHGSREATANAQFLEVAGAAAARAPGWLWQPAFLGHAEPEVQVGIARLAAQGVSRVAVVPLLLFAAGHAKRDLPRQVEMARLRHPDVEFCSSQVLGVDPAMTQACADGLAAAGAAVGGRSAAEQNGTVVLLVGRGSSDPAANAGLGEVARLLRAEAGYGWVENAYFDLAQPRLEAGVSRCLTAGARRIILLPYLLFDGVLMDRLKVRLDSWRTAHPGVTFDLAGARGLGQSPAVIDLIVRRAREALVSFGARVASNSYEK